MSGSWAPYSKMARKMAWSLTLVARGPGRHPGLSLALHQQAHATLRVSCCHNADCGHLPGLSQLCDDGKLSLQPMPRLMVSENQCHVEELKACRIWSVNFIISSGITEIVGTNCAKRANSIFALADTPPETARLRRRNTTISWIYRTTSAPVLIDELCSRIWSRS